MRRLVFIVAALGTLAEALLLAAVLYVLSRVIGAYSMSMNGADPRVAQAGLLVLAVVVGAGLALLGALLMVAAVRDQPVTGRTRILVVFGLVVQWIVAVIVGVTMRGLAFAVVLAVFGCLLGVLLMEQKTGNHTMAQTGDHATERNTADRARS